MNLAQTQSAPAQADRRALTATLVVRYIPLVAAIVIFLAFSLHQLHLPGFYYDEALDLAPMLDVMHGRQPELLRGIGVGRFPVMLLDYMGSLGGYLTLPFMWLFGPGYVAARAQPIFFSCITIVLTWLLARRWFGYGVASVAVLLLAVNPSFIWFSRQGISVTSVMTVFSIGSLLLLDEVIRRESRESRGEGQESRTKNQDLALGSWRLALSAGVLIGLGLWAKLLFLRWVIVLIVIGVVFLVTRSREARRIQTQREHLAALVPAMLWVFIGTLIGALPLIYYNLAGLIRDGQAWTVVLLLNSLTRPTQQFGVNNLDFFHNIQKAVDDARVFVDGSYFWYNGVPFSNVYAVPALILGAVIGGVLAVVRGRGLGDLPLAQQGKRDEARWFFAILAGIATLVVLGAFTVSGLWSTHQFIMLPLPQLVVACAAVWLAEVVMGFVTRGRGNKGTGGQGDKGIGGNTSVALASLLLVSLFLALPFSRDVWVNEQHHATLARTGGSGRFSDAIYKLADWLDANGIHQPVALDWGIEKNLRVLTADRVRPVEIFGFSEQADEGFRRRAIEMLQDPNRRYIVLWERFAVYNRRQDFTEIANRMGRQVVETFIAHEKSGLPVYVVLEAR
ncbi:MAG: glycosyltransferase family 39 protein [Anaerolineae bacterium]|nr:glycosyltransferase family 39 protein [Candidatus Roseilinea sp.]MDW8449598.1 glycosyltransferase family 39 protein [Anaerolineae bacterium]